MEGSTWGTGGAVKATAGGKLSGFLVSFGGLDRTGETFSPDTDYHTDFPTQVGLYYFHGQDQEIGKARLGTTRVERHAGGLFADAQLDMRRSAAKSIYTRAQAGLLGWSSGSVSHLVEKLPLPSGGHVITSWPIGEASVCDLAVVADARNTVEAKAALWTPPAPSTVGHECGHLICALSLGVPVHSVHVGDEAKTGGWVQPVDLFAALPVDAAAVIVAGALGEALHLYGTTDSCDVSWGGFAKSLSPHDLSAYSRAAAGREFALFEPALRLARYQLGRHRYAFDRFAKLCVGMPTLEQPTIDFYWRSWSSVGS
jgi:hypothetical protein